MDRLLRALVRSGTRKGVLGGSRAWMVAGGTAWFLRRLRESSGPDVVYSEELASGQRLVIDHQGPRPRRRDRRRNG